MHKHFPAIDFLKGCLIILVLTEHLIHTPHHDSFLRYIITLFHMPIFIGVSGFLFGFNHLGDTPIAFFTRILHRLIIPWSIATCIYYLIHGTANGFSISALLKLFIFPYYHLWYIPALIGYMMLSMLLWRLTGRNTASLLAILLSALVISMISKWNFLIDIFPNPHIEKLCTWEQSCFKLYNYVFFVFGIFLRKHYEDGFSLCLIPSKLHTFLLLMSILLSIFPFFVFCVHVENSIFYPLNFLLLSSILSNTLKNRFIRSRPLEFIGRLSLPIYLYHVLVIQLSMLIFNNQILAILSAYLLFCVECILIFLSQRIKVVDCYLFGSRSSHCR